MPEGKEECECLRVLEDQLRRDLNDGIDTGAAKKLTLNDLFEVNIRDRQLKDSTRENYTYMYNHCVRDRIGWMKVGNIKYSDIRHFYMTLITELHYRSLAVKGLTNLLTAGRCIGTDRQMQASVRVIPGCYITGQAAGMAAAVLCGSRGNNVHDIDIRELQKKLTEMGAYLPNFRD